MKRIAIKLVIFLLLGAVVNVAVAWMCSARSEPRLYGPQVAQTPSKELGRSIVETMDLFDGPFQVGGSIAAPGFGVTRTLFPASSGGTPPTMAFVLHTESGWPFTSLEGNSALIAVGATASEQYSGGLATPKWLVGQQQGQVPGVLPLRPVWLGFIANTAVYGLLLWLLIRGPLAIRGLRRRARGSCPSCNYPIGESLRCTECGRPLAAHGPSLLLQRLSGSLEKTHWGRMSKRYLLSPTSALLLGVLATVIVAWSCTIWAPEMSGRMLSEAPSSTPTESDVAWWRSHAPAEASPDAPSRIQRTQLGFGKEQLRMMQSARREPAFTPGGVVTAVRAGWPMLSLEYSWWTTVTQVDETVQGLFLVPKILPGMQDAIVPLRPITSGFIVNTWLYGTVIWIVVFGPLAFRRLIRRVRAGGDPPGSSDTRPS